MTISLALIVGAGLLCYESDDGSAAVGDTFSYSGLTYKILTEASGESPGTVQVGNGSTSMSAGPTIVIPSTVTRGDAAYGVVAIGSDAFARASSLVSLTISHGVESIGSYAFLQTGITSIVLPDSMRIIGGGAFSTCESLRSVTVPDGVTEIGTMRSSSARPWNPWPSPPPSPPWGQTSSADARH